MALASGIANADEGSTPSSAPDIFKFSGFATLGAAHSSEDRADFVNKINLPSGTGHSSNWSFSSDSRIGVQIDAVFNDKLSAVLQVLTQQSYDNSYTPKVEWADLKFQITPQLEVSAGRFGIPFFMTSNYLNVGYAQPWLRGPNTVYYLPISNLNGINVNYQFKLNQVLVNAQALYGDSYFNVSADNDPAQADLESFWGGALTAEYGNSTVRLSHFRTNQGFSLSSNKLNNLFSIYRTLGMSALANKYEVKNHTQIYTGLSYSYAPNNWLFQSEIIKVTGSDDITPKTTNWYACLVYRYEKLAPYITVGESTLDSQSTIGTADFIGGINSILTASNLGQKSVSLGARWDFAKNTDLKVQFDHINLKSGSNGGLVNLQPDFKPGGNYDLISVAIDVVF